MYGSGVMHAVRRKSQWTPWGSRANPFALDFTPPPDVRQHEAVVAANYATLRTVLGLRHPVYVRLAVASIASVLMGYAQKDGEDALFEEYGALVEETVVHRIPYEEQRAALAELRRNPHARRHAAKRVRRALGWTERMFVAAFGLDWRDLGMVGLLDSEDR